MSNELEEKPLWDHIVELGIRLRRILYAILIASLVISIIPVRWGSYVPLISYFPSLIIEIVLPKEVNAFGKTYKVVIMPESPFEAFQVIFITALLLGIMGASPVIAYEIWAYIAPALYPHEKRFVKRAALISLILFTFGVLLAVFVIAPWTFRVAFTFYPFFVPPDRELMIRVSVSQVVNTAVQLALAMGLVFQIPLIIYYLLANGIIEPDMFSGDALKTIFVGMLVLAAIISPDPSGLGMLVIASLLYAPFYVAVRLGEKAYYRRILRELANRGG